MTNLGSRIREARGKAGLSQGELEKKLGISHGQISRWERGDVVPYSETLARIWAVLGVDGSGEAPSDRGVPEVRGAIPGARDHPAQREADRPSGRRR